MIRSLDLRTRLILGPLIPILFLIAATVSGISAGLRFQESFAQVTDESLPALDLIARARLDAVRIVASTNDYAYNQYYLATLGIDASSLIRSAPERAVQVQIDDLVQTVNAYTERIAVGDPRAAQIGELERTAQALILEAQRFLDAVDESPAQPTLRQRGELAQREETLLAALDAAEAIESATFEQAEQNVRENIVFTQISQFTIVASALLVSSTLAFFIYRSIAQPMRSLTDVVTSISAGDLSQRANVQSDDEIGVLATTFNEMAHQINSLIDQLRDQVMRSEAAREEAERARAEAERANKVKSAFLASTSHELRTPLNAVINFTKFVAQGDLGPVNEEQRETLFEAVDSARELLALINDVLDMSKIESGSLRLFIEDGIDLGQIIAGLTPTVQTLLGEKPVTFETQVPADLPTVRGDRQRLRQVLLNILSNAAKFTASGRITVYAGFDRTHVTVAIQDTGVGIAPAEQVRVFRAFEQTEAGLRQSNSTGLGMAISKSLMEAHGGDIALESTPGEGSTFMVILPILSPILTPTLPMTPAKASSI